MSRMKNLSDDTPRYWSSIEEYHSPEKAPVAEFDELASMDDLTMDGVSRRKFMAISAAGAALAGTATGCVRKPVEKILPYAVRPEDHIPGKATFFASTFTVGTKALGVVVESQDGRPIKIEGNPQHPNSLGKAGLWAQASILNVYDPERSTVPALVLHTSDKGGHGGGHGPAKGQPEGFVWTDVAWERAWAVVDREMAASRARRGAGTALVLPTVNSPSLNAWIKAFSQAMPQAKLFRVDPAYPANTRAGAALVAGAGTHTSIDTAQANVILSIDSDFLAREGDSERNAIGWAARRRVQRQTDAMNRMYAIEPHMTVTGATADHRLRLRGRDAGTALKQIADLLFSKYRVAAPRGANTAAAQLKNEAFGQADVVKFLDGVAKDLAANRGRALVVVGDRQPAWVHALGHLINEALGANGRTVKWHSDSDAIAMGDAQALAAGLSAGQFQSVVTLGANPVLTAPGSLNLKELFKKSATNIHFGVWFDETAQASNVHLPLSHWLESWGDVKAEGGTVSIQQPLIAPLMHSPSSLEVVARLATGQSHDGRKLLMQHWQKADGDKEWNRWLHSGVIGVVDKPARPTNWAGLATAMGTIAPTSAHGKFELNFHIDNKLLDGRWSNNGWLVELPDPISKLAWDNAAYVSPATAEMLKVKDGEILELDVNGRKLRMPAMVAPGQTDMTVSVNIGWGRDIGSVAEGAGINVYPLQDPTGQAFLQNVTVKKVGGFVKLANVQKYGSLTPPPNLIDWKRRPIIRVAERKTIEGKTGWVRYVPPSKRNKPEGEAKAAKAGGQPEAKGAEGAKKKALPVLDENFVQVDELLPVNKIKSLSDNPLHAIKKGLPNPANKNCTQEYYDQYGPNGACQPPQQWGMSIDLNTCTGCGACLVACVAENNVPVVGKDRVLKGREMHWIRLDRYYEGDPNDPWVSVMPMPCQQCENAPCETVCPVAATAHSPEGLNDMAYNRCIGTRYCANNCPYKVRRFNYFNYNLDIHPLQQMQKNPDVTIRFRGVMEKCTYCVQRISEAKIDAKVNGDRRVPDIDDRNARSMPVISACQQACPTDSIVMGDISDPKSRVSRLKAQPRNYAVLGYLNTWPRTTYLAKIRNPNPDLV